MALVLTTGGLLLATFNPFELLGSSADNSLRFRLATTLVAVRMVKQHALFGVGIAHYPLNFITFRDPMPTVLFGQGIEEAHNYFLWIAAELGLVGLVGFLWLLGGAVRRIWRRLWSDAGDWEFLGMSAGVAAFLLTCVLGQPLIIPEVAFSFWMVLGVTVATATSSNLTATSTDLSSSPRRQPTRTAIIAAAAFLIVGSIPARVKEGIREIDFSRVSYGIGGWEEDNGVRYRWTEPQATFFVRSTVRALMLPVHTVHPGDLGIDHFDADLFVDGSLVEKIELHDDQWHQVRIDLTSTVSEGPFRRVDIRVSPPWSPPEVFPGTSDRRVLGMQIGEIRLDPPSSRTLMGKD